MLIDLSIHVWFIVVDMSSQDRYKVVYFNPIICKEVHTKQHFFPASQNSIHRARRQRKTIFIKTCTASDQTSLHISPPAWNKLLGRRLEGIVPYFRIQKKTDDKGENDNDKDAWRNVFDRPTPHDHFIVPKMRKSKWQIVRPSLIALMCKIEIGIVNTETSSKLHQTPTLHFTITFWIKYFLAN